MLDVAFLNNLQVFLKGLKGGQEVLVTISPGFVLIDEGSCFVLDRLKGGRFAIMGRMRGVGDNYLDRRRGIFVHPGIVRRGGGFRSAGVKCGGKGVSTPPPSVPLSMRHQREGWKDSVDKGDKLTNKPGSFVDEKSLKWAMKW